MLLSLPAFHLLTIKQGSGVGGEKGGADSVTGSREVGDEGGLQDETEAVGSMGQLRGLGKGAEDLSQCLRPFAPGEELRIKAGGERSRSPPAVVDGGLLPEGGPQRKVGPHCALSPTCVLAGHGGAQGCFLWLGEP